MPFPPVGSHDGGRRQLEAILRDVLADLRFPAERWQMITAADLYGADLRSREVLYRLTGRRYPSLAAVVHEVVARTQKSFTPPNEGAR